MTLFRTVARSMSILFVSQAVMWVAAMVFTIAQATYLGPARFGELSVALSYAALLAVLIEFGLGTQLTRLVSQRASGHEEALAAPGGRLDQNIDRRSGDRLPCRGFSGFRRIAVQNQIACPARRQPIRGYPEGGGECGGGVG